MSIFYKDMGGIVVLPNQYNIYKHRFLNKHKIIINGYITITTKRNISEIYAEIVSGNFINKRK